MPKVSVVIPTHNRALFLRAAIQSVLNQTFQDFEIVVVDDASEDHTSAVIRSFGDSRIQYIRHETNKGQGVTRNDGISRALGEYIALLDDDDEWLPAKLEKQVHLLDNRPSKVGLVYTGLYRIDASSRRVIYTVHPEKRGYAFEELCRKNWIGTCSSVLIRKACFDKTGLFDEALASKADYDMWLRIAKEFDIEYIREPLVLYIAHDDTISTNYDSLIQGTEAQLGKYGSLFARDNRGNSDRYFALGIYYCHIGNKQKGKEALLKAIRLYPFAVRPYFYLCLVLLGTDNVKKWKQHRDNYFRR
jgi:glycosyltransferase involved in cell wall biosynthesis